MSKLFIIFDKIERFLNKYQIWVLCSVVLLGFLLLISRRPDIITNPQFWAEDGKNWYAQVYNHGVQALFYFYGGYLVLFYHLVGLISLTLPFKYVPLFFNLLALGIQLSPLVLINSNRLRKIIPYRSIAIIISLLYVSIPNANEVFGNLTNVQWHLGVASFLVLVAQRSKAWKWYVFDVFILLATGLSGPLVIMLLPIASILWWHNRNKQNMRNLILLAVLSLIQLLSIFVFSNFHRIGAQPDANLLLLIKMIVGQIFMGALLGQKYVNLFYGHTFVLVLSLALCLSLIAYAVIKGPLWLKLMNLYSLMLFIAMILSLKPIKGFNDWLGLTNPGGGQRYWYIPMLTWLITLVWLLLAAKNKMPKLVAGLLLATLLIIGIPQSWQIPALPDLHFQAYAQRFRTVPADTSYSIPINPDWKMTLIKH